MIRAEVADMLWRWRAPIWAGMIILAGIWVLSFGGYVLIPIGAAIATLGAGLALMELRRMRFAQEVAAPGIVEVDEAQVGYLGPAGGGFVSMAELVELRLLTIRGRRLWRLKQTDGQALLIPVEAAGAERLFDAFATLPGMDSGALVAALAPVPAQGPGLMTVGAEMRVIWRRQGAGVIAR